MSNRMADAVTWLAPGLFCVSVGLFGLWNAKVYRRRYGHLLAETPRTLMQRAIRLHLRYMRFTTIVGAVIFIATGLVLIIGALTGDGR